MGIRHPLISEIAKDTYLFNEFGLCNHYLLVGTERALLIDCGMGYYDLRATVERMTDKPYDVVITHGCGDIDLLNEQIALHGDTVPEH